MPEILRFDQKNFSQCVLSLIGRKRELSSDIRENVARIIEEVQKNGDEAVISLTSKFDGHLLEQNSMRLSQDIVEQAVRETPTQLMDDLRFAAERIRRFHELQLPQNMSAADGAGGYYAMQWTPVDAAGLYVPGGQAAYPSSVLMNAVAAQVAGVKRLAMTVPTPKGLPNYTVLAAAHLCGIEEIYPIGGAQAIAALALGTQSILPVHVITGPGNAYVAEAKRQLFGNVGIDMIAGPSEVLVVADQSLDPNIAAMDLLAQAEHDEDAQSILLTDNEDYAQDVIKSVEHHLTTLPRAEIAGESWRTNGGVILAPRTAFGDVINMIAPEHLELAIQNPDEVAQTVRHAGAIFMGSKTPEAVGDYVGGPNHVLPTSRSAQFSSGLSVFDFMKRTTKLHCTDESLAILGPVAARLADAEGLGAHAASVRMRLGCNHKG